MADVSKDLPEVIKELKISINKLTQEIGDAGQSVSQTMKAGKLTINKINQQALPPVITLLNRLNNIAANLEKVSKELRHNPSVIIRGTKPAKLGPGEKSE